MKVIRILTLIVTMCITFGIGYYLGNYQHKKDYQAACILSDCCRNMVDNLGVDAEEIYYDYIDILDCDPDLVIDETDIKKYSWCY